MRELRTTTRPRGDAQLLSAARLGDRSAYAALRRRHVPAVRAMAKALGTDPAAADNVAAQAFAWVKTDIRAIENADVPFRPYLLAVVRRVTRGERPADAVRRGPAPEAAAGEAGVVVR